MDCGIITESVIYMLLEYQKDLKKDRKEEMKHLK